MKTAAESQAISQSDVAQALHRLGSGGRLAAQALPQIVSALRHEETRHAAARALVDLGPQLSQLPRRFHTYLKDPDRLLRTYVERALKRLSVHDPALKDALTQSLNSFAARESALAAVCLVRALLIGKSVRARQDSSSLSRAVTHLRERLFGHIAGHDPKNPPTDGDMRAFVHASLHDLPHGETCAITQQEVDEWIAQAFPSELVAVESSQAGQEVGMGLESGAVDPPSESHESAVPAAVGTAASSTSGSAPPILAQQHFAGLKPGDIVGDRYEIVSEVGRSDFAVVYRARQIAFDRVVALKVILLSEPIPAEVAELFKRQALLISTFESGNTAALFDFNWTEDGQLYIVTPFVRGETLSRLLAREGQLEPKRAVHIAIQILASLHEAHGKGLVHGDLRPANIDIGEVFGTPDHVTVHDFGLARLHRHAASGTGRLFGSPRYMAPEQVHGEPPTPASDVYAVGLILFEMLTGRPAVTSDSPMEALFAQVRPPSFQLPSGVMPPPLVRAVNRALEKELTRRFQSAAELSHELRQALLEFDLQPQKTTGVFASVPPGTEPSPATAPSQRAPAPEAPQSMALPPGAPQSMAPPTMGPPTGGAPPGGPPPGGPPARTLMTGSAPEAKAHRRSKVAPSDVDRAPTGVQKAVRVDEDQPAPAQAKQKALRPLEMEAPEAPPVLRALARRRRTAFSAVISVLVGIVVLPVYVVARVVRGVARIGRRAWRGLVHLAQLIRGSLTQTAASKDRLPFEMFLSEDAAKPGPLERSLAQSRLLMRALQATLGLRGVLMVCALDALVDMVASYITNLFQTWKLLKTIKRKLERILNQNQYQSIAEDLELGRIQLSRLFSFVGFYLEEARADLPEDDRRRGATEPSFAVELVLKTRGHLDEMERDLNLVTAAQALQHAGGSIGRALFSLVPNPIAFITAWKDLLFIALFMRYPRREVEKMYAHFVSSYQKALSLMQQEARARGGSTVTDLTPQQAQPLLHERAMIDRLLDPSQLPSSLNDLIDVNRSALLRIIRMLCNLAPFLEPSRWSRLDLVNEVKRMLDMGRFHPQYSLELERWLTKLVAQAVPADSDSRELGLRREEARDMRRRRRWTERLQRQFII